VRSKLPGFVQIAVICLVVAATSAGCDLLFPRLQGGGSATPRPSMPIPCGDGAAVASAVPECLPPDGTLLVIVQEPSGAPILKYSVAFEGPGGAGSVTIDRTGDPTGQQDIHLPLGDQRVTFSADGHQDVVESVSMSPNEVRPLTVVMPPAP
jgi:hypothetical protein